MDGFSKITRKGNTITVQVNVMLFEEGDYFVAYCPVLELSSFGETELDAKNSFNEALQIFIEETEQKGTLEKELIKLGWTLSKSKYKKPSQKVFNEKINQLLMCAEPKSKHGYTMDLSLPI